MGFYTPCTQWAKDEAIRKDPLLLVKRVSNFTTNELIRKQCYSYTVESACSALGYSELSVIVNYRL